MNISRNNFLSALSIFAEAVIVHEQGIVSDVNESFIKLTGLKKTECVGLPINKLFELPLEFDEVSMKNQQFDTRLIINPQEKFFSLRFNQVSSEGDNISYCTLLDISGAKKDPKFLNKKLKEAIQNSYAKREILDLSEYNQLIVDEISIGITIFNAEGRCVFANRAAAQMIGASVSQLIDYNFREVQAWKTTGLYDAAISAINNNKQEKIIYSSVSTFGKPVKLSCKFLPFVSNGENLLMSIYEDISELEKVNQNLKESEEKFKAFYKNSPIGTALTRYDGTFVDVNQALLNVSGANKKELLSSNIIDFYDKVETRNKMLQDLKKNGSVHGLEVAVKLKSGKRKTFIINVNTVSLNEETLLMTSFQDITLRKLVEDKFKESETRYGVIFKNAYNPIVITDKKGRIRFFNEATIELLEYSSEELYGMHFYEISSYNGKEWYDKTIEIINTTKKTTFTSVLKTKSGRLLNIINQVSIVKFNKEEMMLASIHDITEQKKIEEELKNSEERLQLALQGADLGLWDWNVETGELYFSERWATMLGYEIDELAHRLDTWKSLVHPEDKPKVMDELDHHLEKKIPFFRLKHRLLMKDGNWKWILDAGKVLKRDGEGKAIRAVGVNMDISELINAELQLLKVNKEISNKSAQLEAEKKHLETTLDILKNTQEKLIESEKMAALGVLTAGLAHEINNPVNYVNAGMTAFNKTFLRIKTAISALLEHRGGDTKDIESQIGSYFETGDKMIKIMENGIARVIDIVYSMRTFSRNKTTDFTNYDIDKLIDGTIVLFESALKSKSIEVIKDFSQIPDIYCIPGRIQQVFTNLISNSIDSIKDSGEIIIITKYITEKDVVQVTIKDNGVGIDFDKKKKIFDPFYTTKDVGQGSGLGLYLTYKIIEEHEGSIWFETEKNSGTAFYIELPAFRQEATTKN
ncbi:PAS domain-containing sensor histidine kinase [Plebeiibacterium sediminum]|uniref:histidine kinase n=1 Tax=Plebeiibacterium sediminum TaxID=2992112 RepID=A0AAE3SFR1_9BACT|nr:PAS domain S-box protein [Plebeiobacterium sediminum]MCW3786453.1 PAS domain S-box protein [Plebeiobacterium sediminum]